MPSDPTGNTSPARRGRGRPSILDAAAVSEAAIEAWSEQGFASTSWSDLSKRTGISTRTLIRHFPTKADIAWVGVDSATTRLRDALRATPPHTPLSTALREAVVESTSRHPQVRRVGHKWLRLISDEPELAARAQHAYQPWIDTIAEYIAQRIPEVPQAVCRALATAYQAVAFAALTEWADAGAVGDSADAVDEMLRWMPVGLPQAMPTDPERDGTRPTRFGSPESR
ncbi:TetR/AcrR family transcriptional regulator [Gordonia sp. NPDC003424]